MLTLICQSGFLAWNFRANRGTIPLLNLYIGQKSREVEFFVQDWLPC
jgi:hypothetical protein